MTAGGVRARLDGITERLAKITPGVWKLWGMQVMADQDGTSNVATAVPVAQTFQRDEQGKPRTFDAQFIAESAETQRQLAGAVEAVLALADEYRANCDPTSTQAQVAELFRRAVAAHLDGDHG